MIITKVYSIKMSNLKTLYNKFGDKLSDGLILYYYFVISEYLYNNYKVQKFVNSNNNNAKIIPA
jgi:hypothetical protein